jgi:hypothetical protein
MRVFRQADPRFPFLWSTDAQPAGRWHADGEGPAHYFADTPDGAWAEFLRHEEITDPADLETIRRAFWVVEVGDEPAEAVSLPESIVTGGVDTYPRCQAHARELRQRGVRHGADGGRWAGAAGGSPRRPHDRHVRPARTVDWLAGRRSRIPAGARAAAGQSLPQPLGQGDADDAGFSLRDADDADDAGFSLRDADDADDADFFLRDADDADHTGLLSDALKRSA